MGKLKPILKKEIKIAKADSNFREELRRDNIRAEINYLLASGGRIFDYSDRKDISNQDIAIILEEYKRYNPEQRSYRQPGEDIAQIFFQID